MNDQKSIVYVKVDSAGCITEINSSTFITDLVNWIQIDEGTGDKYAHAQGSYLEKPLMDSNNCYNYSLVSSKVVERTEEEKTADTGYVERARASKLEEVSNVCTATVYAGTDITTTVGVEHFSATGDDQMNLSAMAIAVQQGATSVPYHADGKLCRMFTAAEILSAYAAVKAFVTHNVTFCNHLNVWIRRCTTAAEIQAISYTSVLPDDLLANFNAVLGITE